MREPLVEILLAHAGVEGRELSKKLSPRFAFGQTVSLAQTLSRLEQHEAGLLLLDLDLPDASGAAAILRVRRSFPRLPIVALARESGGRLNQAAQRAGALQCWSWSDLAALAATAVNSRLEAAIASLDAGAWPELNSCRLLLAEHDCDQRSMLCLLLRASGARVDQAADGPAALGKALVAEDRGAPYSAVLLNSRLPGLDESAADVLREAGFRRPIIGLAASNDAVEHRSAVDEWLTAPFDRRALLDVLRRWTIVSGQAAPGSDAPLR